MIDLAPPVQRRHFVEARSLCEVAPFFASNSPFLAKPGT
jgi:hypothetical protein